MPTKRRHRRKRWHPLSGFRQLMGGFGWLVWPVIGLVLFGAILFAAAVAYVKAGKPAGELPMGISRTVDVIAATGAVGRGAEEICRDRKAIVLDVQPVPGVSVARYEARLSTTEEVLDESGQKTGVFAPVSYKLTVTASGDSVALEIERPGQKAEHRSEPATDGLRACLRSKAVPFEEYPQ